jgi:hypothetical protein
MLPRAGAAILALTAVFLLAFSVITSAWWAGHPSFGGHEQNRLVVNIGLLGGEGCKLDSEAGADVCEALELGIGFLATGYIELAATGMLAFAALALAVMSLRGKSARRTFAKIVLAAAGASAIVAAALLIQGPDVKTKASFEISLPLGYGMFVFWIGVVASTAAGVLALRPTSGTLRPRTARPVWATNAAAPPPSSSGAGAAPAVDVLALLQEDQLRPRASAPALPPIAAPAGPVARPSPPLFQGAPQLKPLYEVPGATFVPPPAPPLPSRGPTPMPRAAVSAAAGIPTPPATFDAARPKTLPPPLRGKGTSAPPPLPNAIVRPNPLALARTEPQLEAMRGNHSPIVGGDKTIGPVVVPPPPPAPPSAPQIPRPPIVAAPKPAPLRLESDSFPLDVAEAVVEPKRPAPHVPFSEKPTVQRHKPFDVSSNATTHGKRAAAAFEEKPTNALATGFNVATPSDTGEDTDVSATPAPSSGNESFSTEFPTSLDPQAIAEIEARKRDKLAASTDRDLPLVTDPVDPHAQTLGPMPTVQAALLAGKPRPSQPNLKVPISTAPESLPPPTAKQTATVGPSPACPQCESPMVWVEEHLRFYCKSCKMYF